MNNRKNFAIKRQNNDEKYERIILIALMCILGGTSTLHATKRSFEAAFYDTMSPEEMWSKRWESFEDDFYDSKVHGRAFCLDDSNSGDMCVFESFSYYSDPLVIGFSAMIEPNGSFEASLENSVDSQLEDRVQTPHHQMNAPVVIGPNNEDMYDLKRFVEESIESTSVLSTSHIDDSSETLSENLSENLRVAKTQDIFPQLNSPIKMRLNGGGLVNIGKIIDQEEMEVAIVKRNAQKTKGADFFQYLKHEIISEEREVLPADELEQWCENNAGNNRRTLLKGSGFTIQGGVITQLRKHVAVVPLGRK